MRGWLILRALALATFIGVMIIPACNVLYIVLPLLRAQDIDRSPEAVSTVLVVDAAIVGVNETRRMVRIATPTREVLLSYGFAHREVGDMSVGAGSLLTRRGVFYYLDIDDTYCAFITYRVSRAVELRVRLLDDRCIVTITARRLPVSAMYEGVRFGVYEIDDYVVLTFSVEDTPENVTRVVRLPVPATSFHEMTPSLIALAITVSVVLIATGGLTLFATDEDFGVFFVTLGATLYFFVIVVGELTLLRLAL